MESSLRYMVLIFTTCLALQGCTSPERNSNARAQVTAVDPQILRRHVKALSVDYSPRDCQHIENLNAAAEYIRHEVESQGIEVKEQLFEVDGNIFKNLIIDFGPSTDSKLVVGAHYDAAGPYPGADDNASGVAGLIELAKLLKTAHLKQPITLVAYSTEEPPYYATEAMGSYVHAKSEYESGADIELMISIEMIGYFSDEPDSQNFPISILSWFYPDEGNFIAVIDQFWSGWGRKVKNEMSRNMTLPAYHLSAPKSLVGVDFSDHRSYWAFGYDAVMVTDTSFYRNTAYHTEEDTLDQLNYEKMAEVVKGIYGFLSMHAGASQ